MSAYEPRHDPAVHGHAYTVRYQGQDTQPFNAFPEPLPPLHGQYEQPCPFGCPVHPPAPLGETRALLYAGPGIADRTWQARVRNGQWADIPAEFDAAHARVHLPAVKTHRHIHRDVGNGHDHLAVVFSAHPGWRTDAVLAEGLHRIEAGMAGRMAELQDWVARRAAEYRRAGEERKLAAETEARRAAAA